MSQRTRRDPISPLRNEVQVQRSGSNEAKCKTHPARSVGSSPEEREARKKQAQEQRIQQEYRKRLLAEVFKRVPDQLGRHELDLIAQSYFQQLGPYRKTR